jgi:hypothetical protein
MRKYGILLLIMISLGILSICLVVANWKLQTEINSIGQTANGRQLEFQERLKEEKTKIKRGFDEKYRADMVSYKAMSLRIKAERERSGKLRQELEKLKDSSAGWK